MFLDYNPIHQSVLTAAATLRIITVVYGVLDPDHSTMNTVYPPPHVQWKYHLQLQHHLHQQTLAEV